MADRTLRSGRVRGGNAFQRALEEMTAPIGFHGDLEQNESTGEGARERPHQGARGSSAGVSSRRTRERRASTRRLGGRPVVNECETCMTFLASIVWNQRIV